MYASQPLSPVATQHSLPSGRYSLLGPDFHRLDRTSFVLSHLFDHLVGQCEHGRREFNAERFRGLDVEYQLIFRGLLKRQITGLFAAQDAVDVARGSPEQVEAIG